MATDTKFKVLEHLGDGQNHSGENIGKALGISRAAVSAHVKSLNQLGLDIYSVTGKGYKLSNKVYFLNEDKIREFSPTNTSLEIFNIIPSTNAFIMDKIRSDVEIVDGHIVLAEAQTAGRGRRGREWQSPFGSHVYFSQYRILEDGLVASAGLSLAVGIAVANVVNSYLTGREKVDLKWPNDILYKNQKLAGILVEAEGQTEGRCHLVIGIGVNVKMPNDAGQKVGQPWQDLANIIGDDQVDRNVFIGKLIREMDDIFEQYKHSQLQTLYKTWNEMNAFRNKQVDIISPNNVKSGKCLGIDESGALLLQLTNSHSVQKIYGGEVSLRKSKVN